MQADYSSLESRVLGLVAQDDVITQGFLDGKDTHKETASIMNGIPYEDVNKTQRQQAKAITFGLLYGKGIGALAHDLDVSADEAQRLMDKYFETKPKVHEFVTQSQERAKVNGYVETMQGSRRQLKDIWNKRKEAESLRQVVNTTIQGSGAYFTNLSVVMLQEYLNKMNKKSKLILTVHDSIVMDCPRDEYQEMVKVMKYVMENLPIPWAQYNLNGETITYPIVADVELGLNYKDAVDADLEMINTFNTLEGYVKFEKDKAKLTDYFDDKRFGDYQNDNGEAKEKYEKAMEIIENSIDNYRNLV